MKKFNYKLYLKLILRISTVSIEMSKIHLVLKLVAVYIEMLTEVLVLELKYN